MWKNKENTLFFIFVSVLVFVGMVFLYRNEILYYLNMNLAKQESLLPASQSDDLSTIGSELENTKLDDVNSDFNELTKEASSL